MQATATQPRQNERRPLILAAVFGLVAAVLVFALLAGKGGDKSSPSVPQVSAVVAKADMPVGTKIAADLIEVKALPQSGAAVGVLSRDDAIGKTVRYPISRGEQITDAKLVQAAKGQGLAFQIPPGMRGMTIPVSISNTPAALIAPGDFVDVIVTADVTTLTGRVILPPAGSSGGDIQGSATLLQNIQVLSVDRSRVEGGVPYDSSVRGAPPAEKDSIGFVTLAVNPEQAQLLWLAQDKGKITVTLRPFADGDIWALPPKVGA